MTMFHFINDVDKIDCLVNPDKKCKGPECMAWMYKQEKDSESGRKTTNTAKGVCGWLYAMAYFRDRNENPNL
jgi:hypothetical protein